MWIPPCRASKRTASGWKPPARPVSWATKRCASLSPARRGPDLRLRHHRAAAPPLRCKGARAGDPGRSEKSVSVLWLATGTVLQREGIGFKEPAGPITPRRPPRHRPPSRRPRSVKVRRAVGARPGRGAAPRVPTPDPPPALRGGHWKATVSAPFVPSLFSPFRPFAVNLPAYFLCPPSAPK